MVTINESVILDLSLKVDKWQRAMVDAASSAGNLQGKVDKLGREMQTDLQNAFQKVGQTGQKSIGGLINPLDRLRNKSKETKGTVDELKSSFASLATTVLSINFFRKAIDGAREFDKSMREVITIVPEGKAALAGLSKDVSDVSLELGTKAPEAAKAFYQAISSGIDPKKVKEFVKVAGELAQGGATDLTSSVDLLSGTINAYGLNVDNVRQISDSFFKATELGKVTVSEFSSSLGRVAPLASNAGVSLLEVESAIVAMTLSNVNAKAASTNLQQLIQGIIKPTSQAAAMARQLGLSFDATNLQAKGLKGVLDEVKAATGGDIDQMAQLFGSVEALNAALILTGKGAGSFEKALRDIGNAGGSTTKANELVAEGVDALSRRLETAVESGMADFGRGILEIAAGTNLTAERVGILQEKIQGFFSYMQVGIGFTVLGFKRATSGIQLIAETTAAYTTFLLTVYEEGFTKANRTRELALNAAARTFAANQKSIVDGQEIINQKAEEGNAHMAKAAELERLLAIGKGATKEEQTDINKSLQTQVELLSRANALQKQYDRSTATPQFNRQSLDDQIYSAQSRGLGASSIISLQDYLESALESATKESDFDRIGSTLRQRIEKEFSASISESVPRAAKNSVAPTARSVQRALTEAFDDGISYSQPYLEEGVGQLFQETFDQAAIQFRRISAGISIASFSVPTGPTSPEDRAATQALALKRSQEDRLSSVGAAFRGAGFGNVGLSNSPFFLSGGGLVPGPYGAGDTVPIMAAPGEYVVQPEAARSNLPLLQAINTGTVDFKLPSPESNSSSQLKPTQTSQSTNNSEVNNFNFYISGGSSTSLTAEDVRRIVVPELKRMRRVGEKI